jgi:hypothetical protein
MKKKMTTIFIVIAALALLVIAGGCSSSQVSESEPEETSSQVGESEPEETDSQTDESESKEMDTQVSEDEPEETVSQESEDGVSGDAGSEGGKVSSSEPLMAMVDSEEEAQELADACGITLISYQYGIATYDTAEDPEEVVKRSAEKGYPQLELNYEIEMMSID